MADLAKRHINRLRRALWLLDDRERQLQKRFGDRIAGSHRANDWRLAESIRAALAKLDPPAVATDGIDGPRRGPEADGSQTPNAGSAIRPGKAGSNTDTRKLCTCDGAGRGPGRACVVKAGGRLGELWRCAEGHEPTPGVTEKEKGRG